MRVLRTFFGLPCWLPVLFYITGVLYGRRERALRPVRNAGRMWSERSRRRRPAFPPTSRQIDISKLPGMLLYLSRPPYIPAAFSAYIRKRNTGLVISPEGEILTNNHVAVVNRN